jgi:hypothetical protein
MSINIIRLINTAQVAKHHADGQFSEWQELEFTDIRSDANGYRAPVQAKRCEAK